jgi:tetratricopeptide (TPR) repeat protein
MGKKSKRNKNKNGGPVRKGLAAVPTAAPPPASNIDIFEIISRLIIAQDFEKILEVESKYRHLDTFSDNPVDDVCVLYSFGRANYASSEDETRMNRAVHYFERAKERMKHSNAADRREIPKAIKSDVGIHLALLYSDGRDMDKASSSHRGLLEDCNRHQVVATYVINLSNNFNRFDKFEYAIEVLEGCMYMMKTVEEECYAEILLVRAYIGCGELLKAKAANKKRRRSTDKCDWVESRLQSGRIEKGLCNYKAAITHFREVAAELQKQEDDDTRAICSVTLARTLLQHSADNEAEAFEIFQEEVDRCRNPHRREEIMIDIVTGYRRLNIWDKSIEALQHLCLSTTRPDGAMLPQKDQVIAQTCLEQYCTDTVLTIDQRTQILCLATQLGPSLCSNQVDEVSAEMHLTQAQLFYFNGDKRQAYYHIELYLDARLAECKLSCYTCEQRVRPGSVPFSCASCGVASYCDRKHQKMTWKNERICHMILCPLLGYWRVAKKKLKKRHRLTTEDRREYERVFDTFFESICPRGLIIVDSNVQKADSSYVLKSRYELMQIARSLGKANSIAW